MFSFSQLRLVVIPLLLLVSCSKDSEADYGIAREPNSNIYNDLEVADSLKMNQIQYLSSHNSYRKHTDKKIYKFVRNFADILPYNLMEWEYNHVDIYTQLEKFGVRHLEIDIYGDKEGGRFYNRTGYKFTARDPESHIEALKYPGLKVMHIPDLDFETHYHTFIEALKAIKSWSDAYPDHLPVYVMIEAKTQTVGDVLSFLDFVAAEPWDEENIASIEKEILQVFSRQQIIAPDDIRRGYPTLREAVLTEGWLTIGEVRGKVMFMFDGEEISRNYKGNQQSLEGKLIFTDADPSDPDAAYVRMNNPTYPDIQSLVEQGFMVRSMVGGVYENRANDYSKFELAKNKGVHFLSTDYYKPDERAGKVAGWTDFTIGLEQHSYRMNPVTNR